MTTNACRVFRILFVCASILVAPNLFALGGDYPNDKPITGATNWPAGLESLINTTNRVHGYFVNAADCYFFSGDAAAFTSFLRDYSRLPEIESKRLILHEGTGEAKSAWEKEHRACDWKLYVCPKGWHNLAALSQQGTNSVEALQKAGKETGYIVEVHFWTGGHIALDQVDVPKGVEVKKE